MHSWLNKLSLLFSLALLPVLVAAEQAGSLQIGGKPFQVAVGEGYVRTSEKVPKLFELTAAALPPGNRLVEHFIAESDLRRILLGSTDFKQPVYQIQVMRNAEALDFSESDWKEGRAIVARSMGVLDVNTLVRRGADGSNQRLSEAAGTPVEVKFGEIGKPQAYGNDPRSVRFTLLTPLSIEVAGTKTQQVLECGGAIVFTASKIVFFYVYRDHREDSSPEELHRLLDGFVDRTLDLHGSGGA